MPSDVGKTRAVATSDQSESWVRNLGVVNQMCTGCHSGQSWGRDGSHCSGLAGSPVLHLSPWAPSSDGISYPSDC